MRATHTQAETTRQLLAGLLDALAGDMATILLVASDSDTLAVYDSVGLAAEDDMGSRVLPGQGFLRPSGIMVLCK